MYLGIGRLLSWDGLGSTGVGAVPAVAGCQSTRRRLPAPRSEESPSGPAECCHGTAPKDRTAVGRISSSRPVTPHRDGAVNVVPLVRAILLATLTLLVAVPAAAAAPPWSAPRDASPPAAFLTAPGLVAGPGGDALLSWNTGEPARGHLSTLRADGTIVPHGALGGEVVAKPLLRGGDRTVVLARTRRITKRCRTLDQLTVRFGTTTSPRGRVRRVGSAHEVVGEDQGPAIAVHGGEVAVAWVETAGLAAPPLPDRVLARRPRVRQAADARDHRAADARLREHRARLRPRAQARRRLREPAPPPGDRRAHPPARARLRRRARPRRPPAAHLARGRLEPPRVGPRRLGQPGLRRGVEPAVGRARREATGRELRPRGRARRRRHGPRSRPGRSRRT